MLVLDKKTMNVNADYDDFFSSSLDLLKEFDNEVYKYTCQEYERQKYTLSMVASSSIVPPSVLACEASTLSSLTTEGYPGKRYHAGCLVADKVEELAIDRAKSLFKASYANVQPHSGSSANQIILFNLLSPGDTVLSLDINSGGHLSHGAKASITSNFFSFVHYGLDSHGYIDYDHAEYMAKKHKPKLIICGASSYPRRIDFKRFREIADSIGSFLLADISHISGLVATGLHESPIDYAHFTTTSTYKQLCGPRGGLILMGKDYSIDSTNNFKTLVNKATFPGFQGTPNLNSILAKANAFYYVQTEEFAEIASNILGNSKKLADLFLSNGYKVLTEGTDNHMVILDVTSIGLNGLLAQKVLEDCGIIVNKNLIPNDYNNPFITSGIRIGTNSLAQRGLKQEDMKDCFELIDKILRSTRKINDKEYFVESSLVNNVREQVGGLVNNAPIPYY